MFAARQHVLEVSEPQGRGTTRRRRGPRGPDSTVVSTKQQGRRRVRQRLASSVAGAGQSCAPRRPAQHVFGLSADGSEARHAFREHALLRGHLVLHRGDLGRGRPEHERADDRHAEKERLRAGAQVRLGQLGRLVGARHLARARFWSHSRAKRMSTCELAAEQAFARATFCKLPGPRPSRSRRSSR